MGETAILLSLYMLVDNFYEPFALAKVVAFGLGSAIIIAWMKNK